MQTYLTFAKSKNVLPCSYQKWYKNMCGSFKQLGFWICSLTKEIQFSPIWFWYSWDREWIEHWLNLVGLLATFLKTTFLISFLREGSNRDKVLVHKGYESKFNVFRIRRKFLGYHAKYDIWLRFWSWLRFRK